MSAGVSQGSLNEAWASIAPWLRSEQSLDRSERKKLKLPTSNRQTLELAQCRLLHLLLGSGGTGVPRLRPVKKNSYPPLSLEVWCACTGRGMLVVAIFGDKLLFILEMVSLH